MADTDAAPADHRASPGRRPYRRPVPLKTDQHRLRPKYCRAPRALRSCLVDAATDGRPPPTAVAQRRSGEGEPPHDPTPSSGPDRNRGRDPSRLSRIGRTELRRRAGRPGGRGGRRPVRPRHPPRPAAPGGARKPGHGNRRPGVGRRVRVPRARLPGQPHHSGPVRAFEVGVRGGALPAVPDRAQPPQRVDQRRPERGRLPVHRVPQCGQLRAQRVRRRRPHHRDRHQPLLQAVAVPGLGHSRRRRHLGDPEHPGRHTEVVLPRRPAGYQRRRSRDGRPQRPVRQHDLRRHRRGEHLRLGLRGRRRTVQVDDRRAHLDRTDR
jgi:hypothetical protein